MNEMKESMLPSCSEHFLSPAFDLKTQRIKYSFGYCNICCFCGCEIWSLTLRGKHRFENKVLRQKRGPKRELHDDELHKLYSSPKIVTVIESIKMRWAEHVERTEEVTKFQSENLNARGHSEDVFIDGRTMDSRQAGFEGMD
jgi:hypothetical protein